MVVVNGVLLRNNEKQSNIRPDLLSCHIHRATIQGEKWVVLVGLLNNQPYEVFAGLSNKIEIPKKYEEGRIIKHHKKTVNSSYDLLLGEGNEEIVIKNIVNIFDNENNASLTRFVSLSLRNQIGVEKIVEQLLKDDADDFYSFSKVLARTLKKYILNGENATISKECPTCSSNLIYQDGCVSCKNCGWSKC